MEAIQTWPQAFVVVGVALVIAAVLIVVFRSL
jgi:hypothetical protein